MRLLELRGNESSADAGRAALLQKPARKPALSARTLKRPAAGTDTSAESRAFPINAPAPEKPPLRRRPIDLEQLLRRLEVLERRIHERARNNAQSAPESQELEQLRQRMKLLERRIEGELWSARQREHTLLEMLARPPLQMVVKQFFMRVLHTAPGVILHHMNGAGRAWWQHAEPLWWPRFAAAWQEALRRARN